MLYFYNSIKTKEVFIEIKNDLEDRTVAISNYYLDRNGKKVYHGDKVTFDWVSRYLTLEHFSNGNGNGTEFRSVPTPTTTNYEPLQDY